MKQNRFIAIRNQADSTLELFFLDIIQDNYDWWTRMMISKVQEIIDKVNYHKPSKIRVIIDSQGGDAQTGMSIYNFLKRCEAKIEVEIIGLAGSIASVIAMAANKGKLRIARNAFMMIHKAEGMCWGTSEEIRKAADLVDLYTSQIVDIYSQRTGKTVEEINNLIESGDYWMAGEDCVTQGFADETFNENPNLQIAARLKDLDTTVYKNIPAQIRAQLKKPEESSEDYKSFITNQFDQMKKFFTDIVNAIKGVKPVEGTPITNQIAEAVTAPFEKVADEIEKQIDEKVKTATSGEDLINSIVNKVKETVPAVDFTTEGPKNALDTAVKNALSAANKDMTDKITALENTNAELKKKNEALEKDVTSLKGQKSTTQPEAEGKKTPVGRYN